MKLDDAGRDSIHEDLYLCKRSKELELQLSQTYRFNHGYISALEVLLLDVYDVLRPRKLDYEHRRHLIHVINSMAKETYGYRNGFPKVEAMGSFVMDIFTPKSDLDLSLNFDADETSSFPREKKISTLRKFAKIFYAQEKKGNVFGVLPVMRARVPVLKLVDCGTGIECDISVENKDGISKSLMVNFMCQVDQRFQILCFLVKVWAKAQMINSPKDHTLSSLSITLLVALHLQTRDPPILPPFSALLRDGQQPARVQNVVNEFKHYGRGNKELLAELFISLFIKISSVKSLWELGLCASTYNGSWIYKQSANGNINVEDFLDRSENCARAVGKSEILLIYECIDRSLDQLQRFKDAYINRSDLKVLLFGPASLHTRHKDGVFNGLGRQKRSFTSVNSVVDPVHGPLLKKMHYTEPTERSNWSNSQTPAPPLMINRVAYQNLPLVPVGPTNSNPYLSDRFASASWPAAPSLSYGPENYPRFHMFR